jgi:tripartite-type tricarboxylate transporter receptor subunit TctC
VTSAQRLPNAPEIPALAETIPGFEAAPNVFVVAPAGFWNERLSHALRAAVMSPDVQESFAKQGATPMPAQPAELAARIAAEVRRWATVVKDAGIKAE